MHISECFRDVLLLNVFAFSIAKLNEGICIPTLHMNLLSPLEYNVSMVTRRNKHEICLGNVASMCSLRVGRENGVTTSVCTED